ncbi:MAG: hypothetical protein ACQEQB_02020 [Bacteroidota bacterium]
MISGCSSLREVSSIMLACEGKINHLGLKDFSKRSTLSDAAILDFYRTTINKTIIRRMIKS